MKGQRGLCLYTTSTEQSRAIMKYWLRSRTSGRLLRLGDNSRRFYNRQLALGEITNGLRTLFTCYWLGSLVTIRQCFDLSRVKFFFKELFLCVNQFTGERETKRPLYSVVSCSLFWFLRIRQDIEKRNQNTSLVVKYNTGNSSRRKVLLLQTQ